MGIPEMHGYQKLAVERITTGRNIAMWLGMGLGKTRCVIEALKRMGRPRALVIAPAMVVRNVWKQEYEKWDPEARVNVVAGDAKKRLLELDAEADAYVISRDLVKWLYGQNTRQKWEVLVIDESTSFKNASTQRWKSLKKMLWRFRQVILLSGTPSSNGYIDLWAQYYLLDKGERLGKYITEYKTTYFWGTLINGYMIYKNPKRGSIDKINAKVKDITFALDAADVLKLPPTISYSMKIVQTEKEKNAYARMKKSYILGNEVTAANAAVLAGKLRQMANGFVYADDNEVIEIGSSKIDSLREIMDTATENLLIFFCFEEDRRRLKEIGCREIRNEKDVSEWNAGKIKAAIANPTSLGFGINLQRGGHNIIWYSLTWSYEVYAQANARLARQGQEHSVTITHMLTANTIDEKIMQALQNKRTDLQTLIDAVKEEVHENEE